MTHLPPPPVPRVIPPAPVPATLPDAATPAPAPEVRLVDLGLTERPARAEYPFVVTVYRVAAVHTERLPDGALVSVAHCEVKRLTSTDETLRFNDGTERRETYLFLDAQGRVYHHRPGVNFDDGSSYVREGDPAAAQFHFTDQLPGHARDLLGRPLTGNLPQTTTIDHGPWAVHEEVVPAHQ